MSLKLVSWNVNGIRAALKKGLLDFLKKEDPDIFCMQETKANRDQVEIDLPQYEEIWNSAERKGYSGTAVFTKKKPKTYKLGFQDLKKSIADKFGDPQEEGRLMTVEFDKFFLVNTYVPNSKRDLERLDYRYKTWDPLFLKHINILKKEKPVVFCGDMNVAHTGIDLARPKDNTKTHGFTKEEREGFDNIIENGFVDTFRIFNKDGGHYTWWSPFAKARERNVGWRIDYFCVSKDIESKVKRASIEADVMGSDHCPIILELDMKI